MEATAAVGRGFSMAARMTRSSPARASGGSKRRIPLGLLPYSSSESEDEGDGDGDEGSQIGGMMLRQRAAASNARMRGAGAEEENGVVSPEKRRKLAAATTAAAAAAAQCNSSPLRASARARQSPVREGMVDITQKGLSFAHSTGGASAKQAAGPGAIPEVLRSGAVAGSIRQHQQRRPTASAASANGDELSRALSAEGRAGGGGGTPAARAARSSTGPQTPLGAPPAGRSVMTDSRLPAPGRGSSMMPWPPSALKERRASDGSVERRGARASVTWREDVVSPPASRVRLHKEARRQSEEMLADPEASDLADRFGEVAESKPPSPAQTRRRSSAQAAAAPPRRSAACTDRRSSRG